MNSKAYELMVETLLRSKLRRSGFRFIRGHHLKSYNGKSGQKHAIDVSFEGSIGDLKLIVLVECKHYSRRVGVEDVMTFSYRLRDIGAHKGIIVTTCGFQAGAVQVAKAEGIALLLAARGALHTYLGAQFSYHILWIDRLELTLNREKAVIDVVGRRTIAGNTVGEIRPLESGLNARDGETVVFLLPDEVGVPSSYEFWGETVSHSMTKEELAKLENVQL